MSSTNALKIQVEALEGKVAFMTSWMEALEAKMASAPAPAPAKASKKAKDPSAPKQEPNWWLKATQHVRAILKPAIEELNSALPEGGRKIPGTAPVAVTKILKDANVISSDSWEVSKEATMEAFKTFRANLEMEGSVASKASKASSKPKFSDLSDEEKASKRSAAAKKAAATRKANKAKKEEVVAEPEPEAESEAESEEAIVEITETPRVAWKHKSKTYMKAGNKLWTTDGEWVGVWDEKSKTIDAMIEEF